MLVSTHDMALARKCFPRTIVMDEGRIVADGLTAKILENQKLLEAHGWISLLQRPRWAGPFLVNINKAGIGSLLPSQKFNT
jgi:ABC-type hemin transport system ATPase subunit